MKGQNNLWIGALVLFQKLFLPFTLRINCFRDLKDYANYWPSTLNFKSLSPSLEQFFLTVGQNKFWKQNNISNCNCCLPYIYMNR